MNGDDILSNTLIGTLVVCVSVSVILIPLNFHWKDQMKKELVQECMKKDDYLSCVDHVLGVSTSLEKTSAEGSNEPKGF